MPIIPIVISVTMFGVVSWGLNKLLAKVTGRTLDENLDYAEEKVLYLVQKPADETPDA